MDNTPSPANRLPFDHGNRDDTADVLFCEQAQINAAVAKIMHDAAAALLKLDLTGFSSAPGLDLSDIPALLLEYAPVDVTDDRKVAARLDRWCWDRAAGGVP